MRLRNQLAKLRPGVAPAAPPAANYSLEGSDLALTQAAEWVKFADTKATILTAALGVVATMYVTNASVIVTAMTKGEMQTLVVGLFVLAGIGTFIFTLSWLLIAIYPRGSRSFELNRFSWPSLSAADHEALLAHAATTPSYIDAYEQAIQLSAVAESKFTAVRRATGGFAGLLSSAIVSVAVSVAFNALT